MRRSGATYCPSLLVESCRCCPVAALVMVIETFGTAAPVGSVMEPTMVASCAEASAAKARKTNRTASLRTLRPFHTETGLPANMGESSCIAILQDYCEQTSPHSHGRFRRTSFYLHSGRLVKKKCESKSNLDRFRFS